MKISLFLIIFCMLFSVSFVSAQTLSVAGGAKMWFVWWDPFFKDMITEKMFNDSVKESTFDIAPALMAGPNISLLYGDFGFSGALNYGEFKVTSTSAYSQEEGANTVYINKTVLMIIGRTDIDLSLSYRVISQLKIFGGYKFQFIDIDMQTIGTSSTNEKTISGFHDGRSDFSASISGPAFGAGYSYNIGKFFLGANISYVKLFGRFGPMKDAQYELDKKVVPDLVEKFAFDIDSNGYTAEPFIGLQAGDRAIMLLGFRYQHLDNTMTIDSDNPEDSLGKDENGDPKKETENKDDFLGVSLSLSLIF